MLPLRITTQDVIYKSTIFYLIINIQHLNDNLLPKMSDNFGMRRFSVAKFIFNLCDVIFNTCDVICLCPCYIALDSQPDLRMSFSVQRLQKLNDVFINSGDFCIWKKNKIFFNDPEFSFFIYFLNQNKLLWHHLWSQNVWAKVPKMSRTFTMPISDICFSG